MEKEVTLLSVSIAVDYEKEKKKLLLHNTSSPLSSLIIYKGVAYLATAFRRKMLEDNA